MLRIEGGTVRPIEESPFTYPRTIPYNPPHTPEPIKTPALAIPRFVARMDAFHERYCTLMEQLIKPQVPLPTLQTPDETWNHLRTVITCVSGATSIIAGIAMGNTPEGIAMTASGGVILLGNGLIHFCQYNCLGAALIATGSAIGLVGITNPSHVAKTAIGILAAGTDFIQAYHERSTSIANANQIKDRLQGELDNACFRSLASDTSHGTEQLATLTESCIQAQNQLFSTLKRSYHV